MLEKKENIEFGNYAAQCSISQSVNDRDKKKNSLLYESFSSVSIIRYEQSNSNPPGIVLAGLKALLQEKLSSKDFKSCWTCLQSARELLNKAFSESNIKSALNKSGVVAKILSTCPERQLNEQSSEFVLQSRPVFIDLVDEHSVVPEKSFDDFFERSSDIDSAPKKITGFS